MPHYAEPPAGEAPPPPPRPAYSHSAAAPGPAHGHTGALVGQLLRTCRAAWRSAGDADAASALPMAVAVQIIRLGAKQHKDLDRAATLADLRNQPGVTAPGVPLGVAVSEAWRLVHGKHKPPPPGRPKLREVVKAEALLEAAKGAATGEFLVTLDLSNLVQAGFEALCRDVDATWPQRTPCHTAAAAIVARQEGRLTGRVKGTAEEGATWLCIPVDEADRLLGANGPKAADLPSFHAAFSLAPGASGDAGRLLVLSESSLTYSPRPGHSSGSSAGGAAPAAAAGSGSSGSADAGAGGSASGGATSSAAPSPAPPASPPPAAVAAKSPLAKPSAGAVNAKAVALLRRRLQGLCEIVWPAAAGPNSLAKRLLAKYVISVADFGDGANLEELLATSSATLMAARAGEALHQLWRKERARQERARKQGGEGAGDATLQLPDAPPKMLVLLKGDPVLYTSGEAGAGTGGAGMQVVLPYAQLLEAAAAALLCAFDEEWGGPEPADAPAAAARRLAIHIALRHHGKVQGTTAASPNEGDLDFVLPLPMVGTIVPPRDDVPRGKGFAAAYPSAFRHELGALQSTAGSLALDAPGLAERHAKAVAAAVAALPAPTRDAAAAAKPAAAAAKAAPAPAAAAAASPPPAAAAAAAAAGKPKPPGAAASDWPHANNVSLTPVGLLRPTGWQATYRSHTSIKMQACERCGFRGHPADDCRVPYCEACRRWGHAEEEHPQWCQRCGVGWGLNLNRKTRNGHHTQDCPFSRCRHCGMWGHFGDECPKAGDGAGAEAARAGAGAAGVAVASPSSSQPAAAAAVATPAQSSAAQPQPLQRMGVGMEEEGDEQQQPSSAGLRAAAAAFVPPSRSQQQVQQHSTPSPEPPPPALPSPPAPPFAAARPFLAGPFSAGPFAAAQLPAHLMLPQQPVLREDVLPAATLATQFQMHLAQLQVSMAQAQQTVAQRVANWQQLQGLPSNPYQQNPYQQGGYQQPGSHQQEQPAYQQEGAYAQGYDQMQQEHQFSSMQAQLHQTRAIPIVPPQPPAPEPAAPPPPPPPPPQQQSPVEQQPPVEQQEQQQPAEQPRPPLRRLPPPQGLPRGTPALQAVQQLVDALWDHTPRLAEQYMGEAALASLGRAVVRHYTSLMDAVAAQDEATFEAIVQMVGAAAGAPRGASAAAATAPTAPAAAAAGGMSWSDRARAAAAAAAPQQPQPQQPQQQQARRAPGRVHDLPRLLAVCDSVWPPEAGPVFMLRGALAKRLIERTMDAGERPRGGASSEMPQAGEFCLSYWRSRQALYPAAPDSKPYTSLQEEVVAPDPHFIQTRTAPKSPGVVPLDLVRLADWGAGAQLPPLGALFLAVDAAAPGRDGRGMVTNWLAKLLAVAGNPGAERREWGASHRERAEPGERGYSLPLDECEELIADAWREASSDPFPAPDAAAIARNAADARSGRPLFALRPCAEGGGPRLQLRLYDFLGVDPPAPAGALA